MQRNSLKLVNDLDEIYKDGIVCRNGRIKCSVCNKEYKSEGVAQRHIEKKNCYTNQQLFRDTLTEERAYQVFTHLCQSFSIKDGGMVKFRKSRHYNQILKLCLWCNEIGINPVMYVVYHGLNKKDGIYINQFLSYIKNDGPLNKYINFYKSELVTEDDQRDFAKQNLNQLKEDVDFLINSVRLGDTTLKAFISEMKEEFDDYVESLSPVDCLKLERIL